MKQPIGYYFLEQFSRTYKSILDISTSVPEPHPKLLQLIVRISQAHSQGDIASDVLKEAQFFSFKKGEDDFILYIIFLNVWCSLCMRYEKQEQAKVILRQCHQLLSSELPVEAKWFIKFSEALACMFDCSYLKEKKILGSLLNEIPQGALFVRVLGNYLNSSMLLNDHKNFTKVLREVEHYRHQESIVDVLCAYYQCKQNIRNGELKEAGDLLPFIMDHINLLVDHGFRYFQDYFSRDLQLFEILNFRDPLIGLKKFGFSSSKLSNGLQSTQSLLNRDSQAALSLATLYWDERGGLIDIDYILIRAQLANRNLRTARDLIERRQEKCGSSYVDDFFLSKIALIEGNREEAHQRFSKSVEYAKKYDCLSRIKLELRLSCELTPDEAVELVLPLESSVSKEAEPSVKVIGSEIDYEDEADEIALSLHSEFPYLVGSGKWYEELTHKIKVFASADSPVLIIGETGTGKELVARALHDHSSRRDQSYLSINCGALSSSLLQSELFGHVKGAFTGAERRHKGVFEEVGEGTLFLDEMGDAPHEIQTALLRVLESGEYKPIGSSVLKKTNCCLVFATNVDLKQAVTEGRFRKDLYYRLNQLLLTIPPLRERRGDIMLLSKHFLSLDHPQSDKVILTDELSELLNQYEWPGNIRELRNEVEYMKLMNRDKVIYGVKDLRPDFLQMIFAQVKETSSDVLPKQQLGSSVLQRDVRSSPQSPSPLSELKSAPSSIKNSKERRYDQLKELFKEYRKLSRANVCELLGVSPTTATTYLTRLCNENYVEKITPTSSPRTHYFAYKTD